MKNAKLKRDTQKSPSVCERCSNACGKCSWSSDFVPVKGWVAVPTKIQSNTLKEYTDSFYIVWCPQFAEDKKRHTENIRDDRLKTLAYKILEQAIRDFSSACLWLKEHDRSEPIGNEPGWVLINFRNCETFFKRPIVDDMLMICGMEISGTEVARIIMEDPKTIKDNITRLYFRPAKEAQQVFCDDYND